MTLSTARRRFAIFLPFFVLFLIFFGALVTSHGAGLAVPDWPTTFGENMFLYPLKNWVGGIFYEHGHRLIASVVGLFTLILAVWINFKEDRKWVKIFAGLALFTVMLQGVLGGLTVIYGLPLLISTAHAVLAQTFFIVTIIIAYGHSEEYFDFQSEHVPETKKLFLISTASAALIYIQLIIGALMRHSGAGLAIPDFPKMGGSWFPIINQEFIANLNSTLATMGVRPVDFFQVLVHLLHRFGAVLIVLAIFYLLYLAFKNGDRYGKKIVRNISLLSSLVLIQFLLGVATVLTKKLPYLTSFHVMIGALLLGLTTLLCFRTYVLSKNSA